MSTPNPVDHGLDWLDASGDHSAIVLSTRVRLARNLQGHAFGPRARVNDREAVLKEVKKAVESIPALKSYQLEELSEMADLPSSLYRITASGSQELILALPGVSSQEFAVSGDGSTIVVNASPEAGALNDMYLVNLDSWTPTRLTRGGIYDVPTWGANDEHVYFDYRAPGQQGWRVMRRRADGSGANEEVSITSSFASTVPSAGHQFTATSLS